MSRFFLIAGPCAIEDEAISFHIAEEVKKICDDLDIHYIFKGSYEKANRSKLDSFTGIEKGEALRIHKAISDKFSIENITDVHESNEPAEVAPYVSHLQIPAFLCRQTKLLQAAGESGCTVNIKKGQFMSPESMKHAVTKITETGNEQAIITDRGTMFGYQDMIVDFRGIPTMKQYAPVVLDVTHSLQQPNQSSGVTGGRPALIGTMARAGIAAGVDGLFIETHFDPANAKSDGANMLDLSLLEKLLTDLVAIQTTINSLKE